MALTDPRRGRLPLRTMPATTWAAQTPTWRAARPGLIAAALERARSRPSGNWYVFAASREIRAERPLGSTVAGVELVAWRGSDGQLHVGPGACPHLGAPLCHAAVHTGQLVCRWHGLRLGSDGFPGWDPFPAYDDGVLAWVRLDAIGGEEPLPAPVLPTRPPTHASVPAVATVRGRCEPEDVMANRLDPWHGAWFHPYSFAHLRVLRTPEDPAPEADPDPGQDPDPDPEHDRFLVEVTFRIAGRLGVPVHASFHCTDPRTVVMHIVDGEGTSSVVETHATPLGNDEGGHPRTAVIEATIAHSDRRGFALARKAGPALRPLIRLAAKRIWRDDLAYAERRYDLRANGRWPG